MKRVLLTLLGFVGSVQLALATTCPDATAIPAAPTFPYTQSLTCGLTDDLNSVNIIPVCGSTFYMGGQEAVYTWTPTANYINVTFAYTGGTWTGVFVYAGCPTTPGSTCVTNVTSISSPSTTPTFSVTAGVTYYIVFDTFPSPDSPCPGSFTMNASFGPPVAPAAPTQDPAPVTCITGSNIIASGTPPADVSWFWQTTALGTSQVDNASAPKTVFANGTYYLRAYNTVTMLWSPTSSSIVVSNFPLAASPVVPVATLDPSCSPAGSTLTIAAPPANVEYYWQGTVANGTSNLLNATSPYAYTTSGTYHVTAYDLTTQCWSASTSATVTVSTIIPPVPTASQVVYNYCIGTATAPIVATPSAGATLTWFDAATAGTNIGTGTPFETVGTSVMPTATTGTYQFYAASKLGGCYSATRKNITVLVSDVNAVLTPVNVTCNGGDNGSFTLGTVGCGTAPFLYSVNGGTFGPIPTNLTAGTYSVVIQDATLLTSAPIAIVLTQPAIPAALTLVNATYTSADLSWTTTGNETSWNVEYGPTGFVLGSGTVVNSTATTLTLTGLTIDTDYQFYVTAVCGPNSLPAGPKAFSTKAELFTFDNQCGPGFIDISATGTNLNLTDDSEAGITLPWAWSVNGVTVNTITVGNNGGVLFNTLVGQVSYTATGNGMFPYVQDLATPIGGVYHQSIGTMPNRQYVIMWKNVAAYAGTNGSTFEIVVDEATGDVYYIYDDVLMGNVADDFGADAEIALNTSNGNSVVSMNNPTYLTNNSCIRFYNSFCPNPVVTTVVPTALGVTIDWSTGLYGETEWTVIYGAPGFDPALGGGTTISPVTTSDVTITGLTQLTNYDVYIYSECALDNLTSGGNLVNFTTLPSCTNPTSIGGTRAVDSLFATWNFIPTVGAPQALSSFNLQYGPLGFDLYSEGTVQAATGLNFADTVANPSFMGGGVYQVYVQAVCGTDTSNYSGPFTFTMPLSNDNVCGAEMLNVDGTVYTFNNVGATAQTGEGAIITGQNTGNYPLGYNGTNLPLMEWGSSPTIDGSVWFTFVAPASGSMWFSGEDEDFFASQIAIYEVPNCANFTTFNLVAASDQVDLVAGTKVAPKFTICGLTPGATYYILHDAWSNGFGGAPIYGQYSIKMTEIVLEAGTYVDVLKACAGSSVNLNDGITGFDNGGTWNASFPSLNQGITDSIFNTQGFAYQNFQFEYKVTEGCAIDSVLSQVTIYQPSNAGTDGILNVCKNQQLNLLSGLTGLIDLGGTWYNPSSVALASGQINSGNLPGQFNYKYIAGNGVCPNDTSLIVLNVLGTCNALGLEEFVFEGINIFPNPNNGVFTISNATANQNFSYEITDLNGRIVKATKEVTGVATTEVDLSKVENGIYMVRIFNAEGEKMERIVKQ